MSNTQLWVRLACAGTTLVAVTAVGCGGSDQATQQARSGSTSEVAAPANDREEVIQVRRRLENAMYAGDGQAYCRGLTRRAARDMTNQGAQTCEEAVRKIVPEPLPPSARASFRPRVVRVTIDGDTAITAAKSVIGRTTRTIFVKEDGKWMLDGVKPDKGEKAPDPELQDKVDKNVS